MWNRGTGVCEKNTPPEKKKDGNIGFGNTESGAGEQFLLLDCMAKARAKGVFLFTDTGIFVNRAPTLNLSADAWEKREMGKGRRGEGGRSEGGRSHPSRTREIYSAHGGKLTASFRKFNLGKWAQPLGDLNCTRACCSENKQCETLNLKCCNFKS